MAKLTSITSTSGSVYRKEHRSHFGISDPECRVMEEAGTAKYQAEPLLANFSPEHFSTTIRNRFLIFFYKPNASLKIFGLTTYHYSTKIKAKHGSARTNLECPEKPNRLWLEPPIQGFALAYLLFACSSKLLSD
jgi:hypothetical protein